MDTAASAQTAMAVLLLSSAACTTDATPAGSFVAAATNASAVLRPIVADVARDEPAGIGAPVVPVTRRGVRPARSFDLATPPRARANERG